jgi:hypothetical protein
VKCICFSDKGTATVVTSRNPHNSSLSDRSSSSSDQDPSSPTDDFVTPTLDGPFSNAVEVLVSNIEEFYGVHPNDVMSCLKGIKTDVLTQHGVGKPFYKSYSTGIWEHTQ